MTTQRHEIEAWLGDEGWTPEQEERIITEFLAWEADADLPELPDRYDDPDAYADAAEDRAELTEAMLTAIAQRVDGGADLAALSQADVEAQGEAHRARLALRAATVAAVRLDGLSEYEAADQSGVTRMTVRSWLGK